MSRQRGRPPKHPVRQYDEAMRLLMEAQQLKRDGAKRINETLAGANRQADAIEKRRYRAKRLVMHEAAAQIEAEIERLKSGTASTVWTGSRLVNIGTREQLAEVFVGAAEKALKPDKK